MGKAKFNSEHKKILDSFLLEKPNVVPGQCLDTRHIILIINYLPAFMKRGWGLRFLRLKLGIYWPGRHNSFPTSWQKKNEGVDPDK